MQFSIQIAFFKDGTGIFDKMKCAVRLKEQLDIGASSSVISSLVLISAAGLEL